MIPSKVFAATNLGSGSRRGGQFRPAMPQSPVKQQWMHQSEAVEVYDDILSSCFGRPAGCTVHSASAEQATADAGAATAAEEPVASLPVSATNQTTTPVSCAEQSQPVCASDDVVMDDADDIPVRSKRDRVQLDCAQLVTALGFASSLSTGVVTLRSPTRSEFRAHAASPRLLRDRTAVADPQFWDTEGLVARFGERRIHQWAGDCLSSQDLSEHNTHCVCDRRRSRVCRYSVRGL